MATRGSVLVRVAVRLYRGASAILPRDFRREYGAELEECFERIASEAREGRGGAAVVAVTVRSVLDLLRRAPREHLTAARAEVLGVGGGWTGIGQDLRHAARRMRRRPAFTLPAVLTLALGIAAATSVFSLVHGVVLSPLPYPDSERIVQVDHAAPGVGADRGLGIAHGFYRVYAERLRTVESIAMYGTLERTLTGAGDPVRLRGVRATPSLADVLGVSPRLGRWFAAAEGEPGASSSPVVVLSDGLWRERFGADPGLVGRTIELGGVAREVVGVMPPWFAFPSEDVAFWIPHVVPSTGAGGWNRQAVARLAPGADPDAVEREIESLFPVVRETTDDPETVAAYLDEAGVTPRIVLRKEVVVGHVRATLWVLVGTVGFLLVIAVANVANLFLVRAEEGERETALRAALGAGAGRLLRGFLAEALLLALAAGAIGVAAAAAAIRVVRARAPVNIPRLAEVGIDPTVLGVALGTAVAVALVLGLLPAVRRRGDPGDALREGGRRSTAGRRRLRGRNVLVATQVALALVLLIGSGLLFRTYGELRAVDLGFEQRRAVVFELGLPDVDYPTRADARRLHGEVLDRLGAFPGVEAVGAVGPCLPLSGDMCWGETLEAEGRPIAEGRAAAVTGTRVVTADYFRTLGIPVRGRVFDAVDETSGSRVAILSESAAEAYFGSEDPVGERVRFGSDGPWHRVVGVAGDVRGRVETDEFRRLIYLPLRPESEDGPPLSTMAYVVGTDVSPTSIVPAVRRAVGELDPALPLSGVGRLEDLIDRATAPTAFALALIGIAAIMALLLGAVGVYGVVAYAVSRRTAEIGVRMALGARGVDVRRMVVRQGGAAVLAGAAFGLAAAAFATRALSGMLYGVAPIDPATYLLLTALMLLVAGAALWLPAARAARVQPVDALRAD